MTKKQQTWLQWTINVGFWLLIVIIVSYIFYKDGKYENAGYLKHFLQILMGFTLIIIPVIYANTLVLIPRLLAKRRYGLYIFIVILIAIVWAPVSFYMDDYLDVTFFGHTAEANKAKRSPFPEGHFLMLMLTFLSTVVNLSYRWFFQLNKIMQLENEQLNTELMLLKNQINPHFFFNTLHNLYSLSLGKSEEAPNVILKLSDMMRYTIYDCKEKRVQLSQEIEYLENYISLQQIRLYERGTIEFDTGIENETITVAPLLLIVFLENAFKHGLETLTENAYIRICLKANKDTLQFTLENNYDEEERNGQRGGVGLENAKRRLELLYGAKHQLKMSDENEVFTVDLTIDLKEKKEKE